MLFPILLPHESFAYYFEHNRDLFNRQFLGHPSDSTVVRRFWNELILRKDPRLDGHEMRERPNWQYFACPISIHGDGVACVGIGKAGAKSFDIYSYQPLLSHGNTLEVKHYMFGIYESSKVKLEGADTMFDICSVVNWSLLFGFMGIWPTCQPDKTMWRKGSAEVARTGKPLVGGHFMVPYAAKGDLDHLAKAYGLPHYSAENFCALCPCGRDPKRPGMLWNNFKANATWQKHIYSPATWRTITSAIHNYVSKSIGLRRLYICIGSPPAPPPVAGDLGAIPELICCIGFPPAHPPLWVEVLGPFPS